MLQEALEIHDYLNPALWTKNDELLPEVEDRLNKIVSKFQSECMLPLDIVDVHLVGSNASYNYNKYSDLDVHIVVNFDLLDVDKEILMAAYNLQKAQFNRDYDISIHGVNVEMYIEDINAGTMSNGIYSLYNKKWIKKPQKIQYPKLDQRFYDTVKKLADKCERILDGDDGIAITKFINMLYMMRKNGLATDGEFAVGNLLFKELRNMGYLDALKDKLKEIQSQDLTLENLIFENITLTEGSSGSVITDARTKRGFIRLVDSILSQGVLDYKYGERTSASTSSIVGKDITQQEKDIALQRGLDAHHNKGTKTADNIIYLSNSDHGKETNRIQVSGRHNFQGTQLETDLKNLVDNIYSKYDEVVKISQLTHNFATINALIIDTFIKNVQQDTNKSNLLRGYTRQ